MSTRIKCGTCGIKFKASRSNHRACTARCSERASKIRKRYGIEAKDVYEMYKEQDGRCAICHEKGDVHELGFTGKQTLAIDHCHDTGQVRGLLCGSCNKGIGLLRDDTILIRQAIKYLMKKRRFRGKRKKKKERVKKKR